MSASRGGGGGRSGWSTYTPSQLDNSLVANLNKLWSERIEIFAPVEFTRVSILTGIVKISLKVRGNRIRVKKAVKIKKKIIEKVSSYFLSVLHIGLQ